MIKEAELSKIGYFGKPHGVVGEISLLTDFELAGISGDPCIVCDIDGIWTPFFIRSCRQKNASTLLVSFDNMDSEDNVKFFSRKTVYVFTDRIKPDDPLFDRDEDEMNLLQTNKNTRSRSDNLVGYTLIDDRRGTIGTVIEVDDRTLNVLLTVDYKGSEILIPLAFATSIQHKQKTMNFTLPDGFLELLYETEK